MSLAVLIERARREALGPEQALIRMLAQRRASRRVLEEAVRRYTLAAELMNAALSQLPAPASVGAEEP